MKLNQRNLAALALSAIGLLLLPILLQGFGNAWVRIADRPCFTCCWRWA
jgi:branched-chain amino acid transport system permease protein